MVLAKRKLPRLVDIMIKPPYQSEHVPISSVLGEEVIVTGFYYIPSQFEDRLDYLAIEVELAKRRCWFTTSSSYIIDHFERVSQDMLPCRACFNLVKDELGNRTYTVS